MNRSALLAVAFLLGLGANLVAVESPADRVYERLRALEGDWDGTFQWSGGRTNSGRMRATYTLTAGGSALVESLYMNGELASMSTVYHIDGSDLRMTHYCLSRTQPRLKATSLDEAAGILQFDIVDVTGSDPPNRPHVQKLTLQFVGSNDLKLWFTFGGGSSTTREIEAITLKRKNR